MKSISVRVPATSANIGPGFDCLGLALTLYCTVSFIENGGGVRITGCDEKYATEDNIALKAYKYTLSRSNIPFRGIDIAILSDIPVSRGLGSSAALTVAGAFAANEMHELMLSPNELLGICTELEGHPDNAAPALFGGLTASMTHGGVPYTASFEVSEKLNFTALVPPFETSTSKARALLPKQIEYFDAVDNIAHTALLLKALETGDAALLSASLCDKLHEPYRKALIKGFDEVKALALNNGAAAFYISGSGSTCMCISDGYNEKIAYALAREGIAWHVLPLNVDTRGAVVLQ